MSCFKIGIVGSGNVAFHLSNAFLEKGQEVYMYHRSSRNLVQISSLKGIHLLTNTQDFPADLHFCILAVNDHSIEQAAKLVAELNTTVLHTSGSTPLSALSGLGIERYGVFYPLQSFSLNRKMNYSDIPILLETNHSSFNPELLALAKTISKEAQWYHSEQRKKLHLSAVVVNNFVNHLYAQAAHFLGSKETFKMLLPLIHETTARLADEEPAKLQTGPAIRGDEAVIQEHLNLLKEHPQLQDLYQAMTRSIASLKGHE